MLPLLVEHVAAARERLPEAVFRYFAGGSGDELSLGEAADAWRSYRLLPHVLRDVRRVDLTTRLLGEVYVSPVGVAPSGFQGLAHPDGELASGGAAGAAGHPFVLSTRSSHRLEAVAAAVGGPWWFQVYVMRDRSLTEALVRRAAAAGARALVLTGDTPVVGRKRHLTGTRIDLPDDAFLVNLAEHMGERPDRAAAEQDPGVTLEYVGRLAEVSGLPVLVKGVLRADDALACLDAGAAGVVVSTHGGRQLDRALPSALALPAVARAVGERGTVLVDGGIGDGLDCLVALALGADAVLLGRPVVWALAAGGREAVGGALAAVHDDLAHAMALAGAASLGAVDDSLVARPHG
ncbi:alpha-hydroxy acid oxidase [Aquipuribacter nitratireducens]|uniref:Alpha-hydroxy acid oxidase n=1 Tax=Aquipuribacter nitratireducens TaxID=650104 RepID=A0ABW0GQR0_9MICO